MKKLFSLMLITIVASVSAMTFAGTPIKPTELPKAAQTFLNKHFPGDEIWKAEKEQGFRGMEYEADLKSGAEVDFQENGDWKEVKAAHGNAVPAAIIPAAIAKYVSTNFKDQSIVEISRRRGGYEVELSNGTELKLTKDAKPMPARQGGGRGRGNRR